MKKDFDEYYYKIVRQYNELQVALQDMSQQASKGMIEPERVEALKATIAPVVTSFQTLSYIKYLLDKPARKTKHKRYNTSNKLLANSGRMTCDNIVRHNSGIIDNLKI